MPACRAGLTWLFLPGPGFRLELIHERRKLIASAVQDAEEVLREADCGARVSADEHYEEHYQRPADGPTHGWGPLSRPRNLRAPSVSVFPLRIANMHVRTVSCFAGRRPD